jgi:hypothetical protein
MIARLVGRNIAAIEGDLSDVGWTTGFYLLMGVSRLARGGAGLPGNGREPREKRSQHKIILSWRLRVIACRAALGVPGELAQFVAGLRLTERRRRGSARGCRALTCFGSAVRGLRWSGGRSTPYVLVRDHRIPGHRLPVLDEVIAVLAVRPRGCAGRWNGPKRWPSRT